jgi:hypothetical protein
MDDRTIQRSERSTVMQLTPKSVAFPLWALASSLALGQNTNAPKLSDPVKYKFVLVLKYFYWVQEYNPPLLTFDLAAAGRDGGTAEAALGSLVAAGTSAKYNSWLSMWDSRWQRKIEAERRSSGASEAEVIKSQGYLSKDARVLTFVSRTHYVIFRYVSGAVYGAIAFTQTSQGWKATRGIDGEVELIEAGRYDLTPDHSH